MPNAFEEFLRTALAGIEEGGLRRRLRVIEEAQGTRMTVAGRRLLNFSSNDYLGLAAHPSIAAAMAEAAGRWGAGSTASRLICGTTAEHAALEEELAAAKGSEAALVFSSGAAAATNCMPMAVAAPGLFSTTTGCPVRRVMFAAISRPAMSAGPAGVNGTIMRMGLVG